MTDSVNARIVEACETYLAELKDRQQKVQRYMDAAKGIVKMHPLDIVHLTYQMPRELMDKIDFKAGLIEDCGMSAQDMAALDNAIRDLKDLEKKK